MQATRTPAVFIHGMWLHASSWAPWLELFSTAGYDPIAPGWPGEPDTVADARQQPELVANATIDDVTAHYIKVIDSLDASPIIIGHSFGGLFAEKLLGQGIGVAGVAIDPAQIKGVLPLPLAQLYQRAYNDKSAQSRHNNTFYLFEALVKLATAPAM